MPVFCNITNLPGLVGPCSENKKCLLAQGTSADEKSNVIRNWYINLYQVPIMLHLHTSVLGSHNAISANEGVKVLPLLSTDDRQNKASCKKGERKMKGVQLNLDS